MMNDDVSLLVGLKKTHSYD